MEDKLLVRFEHLDDVDSTLTTLFSVIQYLLNYYNKLEVSKVKYCLEQCCIFCWGIYFGILYKNPPDSEEK